MGRLLELELRSDPDGLPAIRRRIEHWIAELGWSEPQLGEIVLALDEALTNVIRHGYRGRSGGRILVRLEAFDDPREGAGLEVRVRDFGRQINPDEICGRDLNDVRPGGLGVHIIRAMTNSAEYQQAEGGGMLLVMRKFRTHKADGGICRVERE